MIKIIIGAIFILLLTPPTLLAGYGFYHGLNVLNGLKSVALALTDMYGPILTGEQMVTEKAVGRSVKTVIWSGDIENQALLETSGLAESSLGSDILFAVNDSGNAPKVFALRKDGSDLGAWLIDYPESHDIEDLASFTWQDKAYLLIADTGDNLQWRPLLTLAIIEEPVTPFISGSPKLPIAWSFQFRYPGGFRDCEAVAVDSEEGYIYLISKWRVPAEVYRVPLRPETNIVTATKVASLTNLPQPNKRDEFEDPEYGRTRSLPTALDMKGSRAIVTTYKDAYLFTRSRHETWAQAFSAIPERIPLPDIHTLESGAITDGGKSFMVTGEREDGVDRMGIFKVEL